MPQSMGAFSRSEQSIPATGMLDFLVWLQLAEPTKQGEHSEGPTCHLPTEPLSHLPTSTAQRILAPLCEVDLLWPNPCGTRQNQHRTEPLQTRQCCKIQARASSALLWTTLLPPQPAANSHTGWHSPCLLLPKPIFPSMESSLFLFPAPGTRSSPRSHPAPAVHAIALHPPPHHLLTASKEWK